MEKRKFWTKDDEQYLIENYAQLGINCASVLNRTEQAVFAKANKLGLKSKAIKPKRAKSNSQYDEELFSIEAPLFRLENYIDSKTPILHECIEGHQVRVTPNHVINSKSGCPVCAGNIRRTTNEYKALIPYEVLEEYINKETPILHRCDRGHEWKARPGHVIRGSKCPYCSISGFKLNQPALCYYVRISRDNEIYYKIGVTNRTVKARFAADTDKDIRILQIKEFLTGQEAWDYEQEILDKYPRVSIDGFLKSGGNTELFETDILGLDK